MNKIIDSDKSETPKLVQKMINDLKPPVDVAEMLTTSLFMTNRFTFCPTINDVLRPAKMDPLQIHWY